MTDTAEAPAKTTDELVGRLFGAGIGMFDVMSVYLGDRLGLYRALRDGGPATSAELASRAGIAERYAREWLEQQATTGFLVVDDAAAPAADRRFALPEAYAEPLLDPDSPWSIAPLGRSVVACAKAHPRRPRGVPDRRRGRLDRVRRRHDRGPGRLQPALAPRPSRHEILPALPDIHARLTADPPARVADVACGVGWAAIAIATAYPDVRVDGFDLDPSSIELAQANAREAGVADRVTFAVRDAADPAAAGSTTSRSSSRRSTT